MPKPKRSERKERSGASRDYGSFLKPSSGSRGGFRDRRPVHMPTMGEQDSEDEVTSGEDSDAEDVDAPAKAAKRFKDEEDEFKAKEAKGAKALREKKRLQGKLKQIDMDDDEKDVEDEFGGGRGDDDDDIFAGGDDEDDDSGHGRKRRKVDDDGDYQNSEKAIHRRKMAELFGKKEDEGFMKFTSKDVFNRDGSAIPDKEEQEEEDPWLLQLDEKTQNDEEAGTTTAIAAAGANKQATATKPELTANENRKVLISLMVPGENVLKAMKRLAPKKQGAEKAKTGGKKYAKKKEDEKVEKAQLGSAKKVETETDEKADRMKECFDKLVDAANLLLDGGVFGIYQHTYERLKRDLKKESEEKEARQEAIASSKFQLRWEYKWTEADEQIFGPFTCEEMDEWRGQQYFLQDEVVRRSTSVTAPGPWEISREIKSFAEQGEIAEKVIAPKLGLKRKFKF